MSLYRCTVGADCFSAGKPISGQPPIPTVWCCDISPMTLYNCSSQGVWFKASQASTNNRNAIPCLGEVESRWFSAIHAPSETRQVRKYKRTVVPITLVTTCLSRLPGICQPKGVTVVSIHQQCMYQKRECWYPNAGVRLMQDGLVRSTVVCMANTAVAPQRLQDPVLV